MIKKFFLFILLLCSCSETNTPKPYGYKKISLKDKALFDVEIKNCPFKFKLPKYSEIFQKKQNKCWFDIDIDYLDVKVYITYIKIKNKTDYNILLEDSRNIVYKHIKVADNIEQKNYSDSIKKIYSNLYTLDGNVASPIQFSISDKKKHFLRGGLYFNNNYSYDSLKDVRNYLKEDIVKLIESITWKN